MNEVHFRAAERRLWDSVGLAPRESFVTLPRLDVEVRVQEVGEGEPVLFIHGGPNSGSTWAPIVGHLEGFRCVLVDRPGTGLSEPYRVDRHNLADFGAAFVGDLADGLEHDRVHVVASSFGGYLAIQSASLEPGRIRRMVQMACPAFAPGMETPPFMRLLALAAVRRTLAVLPPSARANRAILRQIGHGVSLDAGLIPQSFLDWYLELGRHTDTMVNDSDMIGRLGSVRGFDPVITLTDEVLARVTAPTLFLWGGDDAFGGAAVARGVADRMPYAQVVMMPAAGHLPWLDDPVFTATRTGTFLADDTLPRSAAGLGTAMEATNE